MSMLDERVERERVELLARSPKKLSPIGDVAVQSYADGYRAGLIARPTEREIDAAMRYLAAQNVLRKDITIMAAMSIVAGMCSAMSDALEEDA